MNNLTNHSHTWHFICQTLQMRTTVCDSARKSVSDKQIFIHRKAKWNSKEIDRTIPKKERGTARGVPVHQADSISFFFFCLETAIIYFS